MNSMIRTFGDGEEARRAYREWGYPYSEYNLFHGTMRLQGVFRQKAPAIRQAKADAERTHESNERIGSAVEDRSELFVVVDERTGEVIGGRMIVEADGERTVKHGPREHMRGW